MTVYGQQSITHIVPFNDQKGYFFILMYFLCSCDTDNKIFTKLEMRHSAEMIKK